MDSMYFQRFQATERPPNQGPYEERSDSTSRTGSTMLPLRIRNSPIAAVTLTPTDRRARAAKQIDRHKTWLWTARLACTAQGIALKYLAELSAHLPGAAPTNPQKHEGTWLGAGEERFCRRVHGPRQNNARADLWGNYGQEPVRNLDLKARPQGAPKFAVPTQNGLRDPRHWIKALGRFQIGYGASVWKSRLAKE
jgi:hypothetical protein